MSLRRLAAVTILAASSLALAGCGSPTEPAAASASPTPSATAAPVLASAADDAALIAAVTWSDDAAGLPTLAFPAPLAVTAATGRLVADGDGAALEAGQMVAFHYVAFDGVDGLPVYSTYDTATPQEVLFTEDAMDPALWDVFSGTHIGATIIFAAPDVSVGPDASGRMPTVVMALTVTSATTVLARAEGDAVVPLVGTPVVTLAESGAPAVDFTGLELPTELVVQPLITGTGPLVAEGQNLTVHYTGWLWDGEQFDSSWDRGAASSFPFVQGGLIDGWIQGLTGQTVGSQILLVVPPALAYGDQEKEGIPPGSTLVFVVDILAAS